MKISLRHIASVLFAGLLLLPLLGACRKETAGRTPDGRLRVMTGIPPLEWLARQIAGDKAEVTTLLGRDADPETFEPSMKQLTDLQNSAVYFAVGGLPFEESAVRKVKEGFPGLRVIDTAQGVERLHGGHSHSHSHEAHGHSHGEEEESFDPHVWTSVASARVMASNICNTLSALDPANAQAYRRNLDALNLRLDTLSRQLDSIMAPARGATFITGHPSLSYFARDYGLHQLSLEQGGKEVTPERLARLCDEALADRASVIIYDASSSPSQLEAVAEDLKLPMRRTEILSSSSWPEAMLQTARAISSSLKK